MLVKHNDVEQKKKNTDLATHFFFQTCYSKHSFFSAWLFSYNNQYFFGDKRSHFSRVDSQSFAKMWQMDTPAKIKIMSKNIFE